MLAQVPPGSGAFATKEWNKWYESGKPAPPEWDETAEDINANWLQVSLQRFQKTIKAFSQWEGAGYRILFYFTDNEIHHPDKAMYISVH